MQVELQVLLWGCPHLVAGVMELREPPENNLCTYIPESLGVPRGARLHALCAGDRWECMQSPVKSGVNWIQKNTRGERSDIGKKNKKKEKRCFAYLCTPDK